MNVKIEKAEREDLNEILELQYLAYQSEAALFGTNDIPPLRQTLDEVVEKIMKHEITDGKTIALTFMIRERKQHERD